MSADERRAAEPAADKVPEPHDEQLEGDVVSPPEPTKTPKSVRFWGTFASICLLAFIATLDLAIITTSLPEIIASVGGASQYIWIANSFVVASAVLQPLVGQLANALGRGGPLIVSTALFALGSGIAAGASNSAMLIAGRTIQGVGSGGVLVLIEIVCCDLVPLRERGKYLGMMFSCGGIGAALGPPVGGALAQANWRWIFWINLPICGIALASLLSFMRVKTGAPDPSVADAEPGQGGTTRRTMVARLKRLDYLGNAIFTPSMVSLLFGLVEGGTVHPWSSWRIILPLVLGIVGWIVFHIQQHFAPEPSIPARLFANRTSATAFLLTFFSGVILQVLLYFIPIYFQGVVGTDILDSGVYYLPMAIGTLVFAVVAGNLLNYFGKYRAMHAVAFAMSALAFGLLTRLDADTPKVEWAWYQLVASVGSGLLQSVLLPAIMAGLPEADVAAASSAYGFIRTFGWIWGVTAPSIIFNAVFDQNLDQIPDPGLRALLSGGQAYSFASQVHTVRDNYSPAVWNEVTDVYIKSLKAIWWFGLAVSLVSFLAVGGEKEIELRKELETEYGLEDAKNSSQPSDTENGGENRGQGVA